MGFTWESQMRKRFTIFLLLAGTLIVSQPPSRLSQHSVPCEHVLGLTYTHASVNGSRPLTMVLDSGAFYTILQPEIAAELKINVSGTEQTSGLGADATLKMVQNATLDVAGETLTGQRISVLPLDYIDKEAGHRTDGLLGGNVFMNFDVVEDYRAHTVTLVPPKAFTPRANYSSIPVMVSGNLAFAQLDVAGSDGMPVKGTFLIDSGNVGNITLTKGFINANPSLEPKKLIAIPSVTAVGGKIDVAAGRLRLLHFGSWSMHDLPAAFLRTSNPGTPATFAGLLGNGILRKFDVIFDYPHGKLWLKPSADFREPFPVNASGLLLTVNPPDYAVVLVRDVLAGSPAAQAGVQPGDRIVGIQSQAGKSLNANSLAEASDAMSRPGEQITLDVIRGGKPLTFNFETRSLI